MIINGSPRKNGATAKVLNEFAGQLASKGADATMFHLSDLEMTFCKGCCGCYKTGQCFLDDDAKMLSKTISEADGLIIGTPCYVSDVSGQLKAFIDRGHFVFEQLLKGKHTIGVVTYENYGGSLAYKTLKSLFVFSGAKTVDKLIIKTPFGSNPKAGPQIASKAARLHSSIKNNKSSFLCGIINFFVLNFGIKPFVRKKGEAYQGVLQHWEERGIPHRTI
ncbi:MAG: flavodoxin family protein [Defluviitaleaceae bacterium]|nr:flavodoxin family protein [Defluviitaleaceae bacterium]